MSRKIALLLTSLSLLLGSAVVVWGPPQASSLDRVLDELFAVHEFREVAISPDGRHVAWVESQHGPHGEPSPHSAIYVANLGAPPGPPRRITAGDRSTSHVESDVAWAPDCRRLAFLSDREKEGQPELYVADVAGGSARRLTNLTGALAGPAWSPDGKTIALLFIENAPRVPGPMEPMLPPSGLIEQQVFEQRLATVDVASGQVRQISPPDLYIYEFDWSPDGKRFAVTAAHGAGDANWYIAQLYTLDAYTGTINSLYKPQIDTQIAVPRWSRDGNSIAFIGGLMSDEGNTGGDVYLIPASGGEPRNLTPRLNASASWLAWLPTKQILMAELIEGESALATLDPASGEVATLWRGADSNSTGGWTFGASLARDGKTSALVRQSFEHPPEVWAGPIGAWQPVTHVNQNAQTQWGKSESLRWTNDDFSIQGWLIYPHDYDPGKRYPLVVSVHGGPGSMVRPAWPGTFFNFALLSHEGYFVLYPNPRGSFGEGEAFTRANVKDFGYGDLRDILAGVDQVVKRLPVDDHRVGIGGWSYGGFMTMWAVTQTQRFHAAVAGAGIANWQSYYGENDIDLWMIPFFGASVYDDPAVYAKSSPITFIKNVKTPTLVLVGDRDGECPVPQSFEFWHALKALGVETKLVVYPDEGHQIWQPYHRRDIMKRTVAWYNEHLR